MKMAIEIKPQINKMKMTNSTNPIETRGQIRLIKIMMRNVSQNIMTMIIIQQEKRLVFSKLNQMKTNKSFKNQ